MGMQISHNHHSEVSEKEVVWEIAAASRGGATGFVSSAGDRASGGAFNAGPHSYAFEHSSKVQCCACDRVYQREECRKDTQAVIGEQARNGVAFLGERVLREYSGIG